jgi:hypothetical protein
LLGLLFESEDGIDIFVRNAMRSPNYAPFHIVFITSRLLDLILNYLQ